MNIQIHLHIGLLYFVLKLNLFDSTLTVLELNLSLKKLKTLLKIKIFFSFFIDIKTNIFRIQSSNSVMRGYFCIGFIYFMFSGKTLIDYTSLLSPYDFQKIDSIILKYFKDE